MVCVRPGLELTCASFEPISELSRLDLPTLERPRKAISDATGGGNFPASATEVTNCAWTFMVFLAVNFIASGAKALGYCASVIGLKAGASTEPTVIQVTEARDRWFHSRP